MLYRPVRSFAVVVLALVTLVAFQLPAEATVRTFRDKGAHVTTVKVSHGFHNVVVRARVGPYRLGSKFTFWLDTDPTNPGPEYKTRVYPNSDGINLFRVESFSGDGPVVPCGGFTASADVFGPEVVRISIPRSCLGTPAAVRVSIRAYYDEAGPNVIDWAPGRKKFFGWVSP